MRLCPFHANCRAEFTGEFMGDLHMGLVRLTKDIHIALVSVSYHPWGKRMSGTWMHLNGTQVYF